VPAFLVGQCWPWVTTERLLGLHTEGAEAMEEMDSEGRHVRNINCTLVPSERAFLRCVRDDWPPWAA
jgi:hypothetical protein